MKKHIPNTLTCCNLLAGCVATWLAFRHQFQAAFLFIVIGALFDFFDGFAARLLRVSSAIGKELDSLADNFTFGFAPAAIVFSLLQTLFSPATMPTGCPLAEMPGAEYLPYLAFLIAPFSALRLAKFNLDERQTTTFIGLPTPANALFWGSLATSLDEGGWLSGEPWVGLVLLPAIFLSCWLLVCEIPMFALKFKTYGLQGNILRYSFILCSLILLCGLGWVGFSAIIVLYVFTSIMNNIIGTKMVEIE